MNQQPGGIADTTSIYARYNLYTTADTFHVEPCFDDGAAQGPFLEIDRITNAITLIDSATPNHPIPMNAHRQDIFGIVGIIDLVSGPALIVITNRLCIGKLNGHEIYAIKKTDVIPYKTSTLHLTEKQKWYERLFLEMTQSVLNTGGFYYSCRYDITHTLQRLNATTPHFRNSSMIERADQRFVWNRYVIGSIATQPNMHRFALPIMHGFVGIRECQYDHHHFQLMIISRRSIYRAGTRYHMRGVNADGHSANYVETEQIVEFDRANSVDGTPHRYMTAFVQTRGSLPLIWSQHPNLRWQPTPTIRPADDQTKAFARHMDTQRDIYAGHQAVINLLNQRGRERQIGAELDRVIVQAALRDVVYYPFDFHHEVGTLNWDRLSVLVASVRENLQQYRFFGRCISHEHEEDGLHMQQTGYFRTNCLDSLDRTNVVQSLLAKESLTDQLRRVGILPNDISISSHVLLMQHFKDLWVENGDECSRQYAGTGALKTDFTRLGHRTYRGMFNDLTNALSRYFRNNFADGYRQDSIDLFLGHFHVNPNNLPPTLQTTLLTFDLHGFAIISSIVSFAMVILCMLVADHYEWALFWFVVVILLLLYILANGEEFVNTPKLRLD